MLGQLLQKLASATLFLLDFAITPPASLRPHKSFPAQVVHQDYRQEWNLLQSWGQYSPWFSVPSGIPAAIPPQCEVTFAQVLSRHGSRDPTTGAGNNYRNLIHRIHKDVRRYGSGYSFIQHYQYNLGTEHLTAYGARELRESGTRFFARYQALAASSHPFIRAASQERVVMSARNWTWGYYNGKFPINMPELGCPEDAEGICIIREANDSNNTLSQEGCAAFESDPVRRIVIAAKQKWASEFVPPIRERLNANLPNANLSGAETIWMMDLCPFNTIASPELAISPFCSLFHEEEWRQYDYLKSLDKYYGHGDGNPFAPTMGVGYVNELIARLTGMPVEDHTTTNHTLDQNATTFPLGRRLYADFSHDNDMTHIFFALQLYNSTQPLSNTSLETVEQTNGYSAAWTVPFAARIYVEKLKCAGSSEEMVRVLMNDRVLPLETCGGDKLGRCTLSKFVDSLSFAVAGGRWDECSLPQ